MSRLQHHTFLSSKSTAGTVMPVKPNLLCFISFWFSIGSGVGRSKEVHNEKGNNDIIKDLMVIFSDLQAEWMAPEVLRNEPSNEK